MSGSGGTMDKQAAAIYLRSLINKQLLVHTNDSRMFGGEFKCTDNERNIILARAFEYRLPSSAAVQEALVDKSKETESKATTSNTAETSSASSSFAAASTINVKATVPMTSRYMGLVVVPGRYITRIEKEERPWEQRYE